MATSLKVIAICILVLLFSEILIAQQTGEIRGKISDEKGEALPGVSIAAKSPSLQGLRTGLSDRSGNFRLPLLPVGAYSVTFELAGFEKLEITGQDIRLGFTVSLAPVLKPSAVSEEVTVVAPAPLIDKTKADNSYRLNSDELAHGSTPAALAAAYAAIGISRNARAEELSADLLFALFRSLHS